MKRRLIAWGLAILTIVTLAIPTFAHDRSDHNNDINAVLFRDKTFPKYSEKGKKLNDLEEALALCIDQFNGSDQSLLDDLCARGIHGIPNDITKIDLDRVSPFTHRSFTHLGWNHHYNSDADWETKWQKRREILLRTVNKTFNFQWLIGDKTFFEGTGIEITLHFGYDEQCDAFAAFLYYIHILSDYKYHDNSKKDTLTGQIMPLITKDRGKDDIFSELEKILPILFEDSVETKSYQGLEKSIKLLEQSNASGSELANSLLEKLKSKVPELLKEEPFFQEVFYK